MPKEVLIYGSIEQWSVADFIKQIDESEGDLVIRVNSKGGSPEYGFGLVAKLKEYEGRKTIKVDGTAFSFGAFLLAYADEVEALDVAEFMIHRAAYPAWFEQSAEYFTDELKGNLARVNKSLRTAFENKIDVDAFAKLKGVTMDELFSMDSRKDVFLSAKEAKKIGLINKITTITPEKKAEIDSIFVDIAAKYNGAPTPTPIIPTENKTQKIETKMTIEDLKSQHPSVYASAFKGFT
jgi:ATP-dependent protease ClpP protease subunit